MSVSGLNGFWFTCQCQLPLRSKRCRSLVRSCTREKFRNNVSVRFYSMQLLIWIKCQCQCQVWTPRNLIWQICAEQGTPHRAIHFWRACHSKTIFQPASQLEKLLEWLLGSWGGGGRFGRKLPEGGQDFLEVALVWKFPHGILPKQTFKVARLQSEFCTEDFFFELRIFLRKMLRYLPRNFCASILWVRKIPQNSRQISHQISRIKISKISPTSFCRSAGRTNF